MTLEQERRKFISGEMAEADMKTLDGQCPGWLALEAYSEEEKEFLCVREACGLLGEVEKERIASRAPQFPWKSRLEYERKVAEWRKDILGTAVAQPELSVVIDGYAIGVFHAMMNVVQAVRRAVERMEREGLAEVVEVVRIKVVP